jgi:hypothetical protein
MIIVPSQARDKHRENSKGEMRFLTGEFVLIDDELQQYRMHRLFSEEATGLLFSIDKYKLNKSSQPSRYAYDVLASIVGIAAGGDTDTPAALPFATFLDGLCAPPTVTNRCNNTGYRNVKADKIATAEAEAEAEAEAKPEPLFFEWSADFVLGYQRSIEKDPASQGSCVAMRAVLQKLADTQPQRRQATQQLQLQQQQQQHQQQLVYSEEHDGVHVQVFETIRAGETTAEGFLSVAASNNADEAARLNITGLRNTSSTGAVLEPPNFALKSLSQCSSNLVPRATRVVLLGPIFKLDPAQDWGGVALQWSCHRSGWASRQQAPAPAPTPTPSPPPPLPMASNLTTTSGSSFGTTHSAVVPAIVPAIPHIVDGDAVVDVGLHLTPAAVQEIPLDMQQQQQQDEEAAHNSNSALAEDIENDGL